MNTAKWTLGPLFGTIANVVAVLWIAFEVVLFSMPVAIPVTVVSMNYAAVVYVGFAFLAAVWYLIHARKGKTTPIRENDFNADIAPQSTKAHLNLTAWE